MVRCKQILFKINKVKSRLSHSGRRKRRTRGASEAGEYSISSSPTTNTAVEKLRSSLPSFGITYLQYHVLWEQTTVCMRRPLRERE